MLAVRARMSAATHIYPKQHGSLTDTFLKDAVTDRLKDDIPEVVSATLKVVEVSEDGGGTHSPTGQLRYCLLFAFISFQLLYDVLDPEHVISSLLSVLHRAEQSAEQWFVTYTKLSLI